MNPPTNESTVLRILSNALMGIGSDVGRLRWALHPHLTPDAVESLERLQKELISRAIDAENEAGIREYQATLAQPVDPAPPSPSPQGRLPVRTKRQLSGQDLKDAMERYSPRPSLEDMDLDPSPQGRCPECDGTGKVVRGWYCGDACACGGTGTAPKEGEPLGGVCRCGHAYETHWMARGSSYQMCSACDCSAYSGGTAPKEGT